MKKLFLIMLVSVGLNAAPAYNGEVKFKNKDNSSFNGSLKGDEYFSWIEDKSGNVILYNNDSSNYEYAKLVEINGEVDLAPSGSKAGKKKSSSASTSYAPSSPSNLTKTGKKDDGKISKKILHDIWKRKKLKASKH